MGPPELEKRKKKIFLYSVFWITVLLCFSAYGPTQTLVEPKRKVRFFLAFFEFRRSQLTYLATWRTWYFLAVNQCNRIIMKFDTTNSLSSLMISTKFEENRFRFRYSSHIYVSPDFSSLRYRSCICHRIFMTFGTEKFLSPFITAVKFEQKSVQIKI